MIVERTKYSDSYIPKPETINFFIWLNTFFDEENKSAESHFQLIDHAFSKYQFKGFECSRGLAKALSLDSVVHTIKGTKTINDVCIGDSIYGSNGKLCNVIAKSNVFNKPMYRLTFKDGRTVKASEDHIWTVYKQYTKRINSSKNNVRGLRQLEMTTKELFKDLLGKAKISGHRTKEEYTKYSIPISSPIKYERKDLVLDSYTLGCLIGDGSLKQQLRFCSYKDDTDFYLKNFPYEHGIIRRKGNTDVWTVTGIKHIIRGLGLHVNSYDKFIPTEYMFSSIEQRTEILRGLMDTDGTVLKGHQQSFTTVSKKLSQDFLTLVYSLGAEAKITSSQVSFQGSKPSTAYKITFSMSINPFKLPRKANKFLPISRQYMAIKSIEAIEDEPSQCISVDSADKLFLTDNFIVTHNSTLIGIYLLLYIAFLGRKPNFGRVDYILYIMDTVGQVGANFEQLIMILEENKELGKHLKIKKSRLGDDPTLYIYNVDLDRMIYFKGRGSGQKMRGTRINGKRPNIILLDDIENDENVESKESRKKLSNWFFNAVIPAVNPNRFEVDFIGTPIHQDSLLINLLEGKGEDDFFKQYEFAFLQLPAAENLTLGMIKGTTRDKIISAWSDRFTVGYLRMMYGMYASQDKLTSFWQEYMLQIAPKEDLLYDTSKIHRYKMEDIKEHLSSFTYYISVDLAISESSTADYTALAVIGINENNDWFLVDGFFQRGIQPDKTIEKIFEYVEMYRPYSVILEKVAFQTAMKTFIQKEMLRRNRYFSIDMVTRPNRKGSKLQIFKAFQPIVNMGKFWVPESYMASFVDELFSEMSLITNDKILSRYDDLIDAVAQLTLVNITSITPIATSQLTQIKKAKNTYRW